MYRGMNTSCSSKTLVMDIVPWHPSLYGRDAQLRSSDPGIVAHPQKGHEVMTRVVRVAKWTELAVLKYPMTDCSYLQAREGLALCGGQ